MTAYEQLVEALRCEELKGIACPDCYERECIANSGKGLYCRVPQLLEDAAAAIEALNAEETRLLLITSELQDKVVELEEELNDVDIAADDNARQVEELQARLGEAENSVERWKDMYLTKHEPKREEVWKDVIGYGNHRFESDFDRYTELSHHRPGNGRRKGMSDLIDRQALRAAHGLGTDCATCKQDTRSCQYDRDYSLMDFCEWIDDAPAASPWHRVEEPPKEEGRYWCAKKFAGHWIFFAAWYWNNVSDYTGVPVGEEEKADGFVFGEDVVYPDYWMPIEPPKEEEHGNK